MGKTLTRKSRFLLVYPLLVWLLLVARTTEQQLRLGAALVAVGILIRFWANGYVGHVKVNWTQKQRGEAKIGRLVTAGPYAFVRNPLYLGTLVIGVGFCLIAGNLWVSLVAAVLFLIVYRRKIAQEERLLRDEVGEPFVAYHAAVPRLLPSRRRYLARHGRWSWQGIGASKEWKTIIWVVVAVLALYFREELLQERERLFMAPEGLKRTALLIIACVLMLTDGVVELTIRRRRALHHAHPASI